MAGIALEEYELLGDARYRSYVSAIDKALKSFEYTSEWADLISALGKLNKVLLSHTKYLVIPRRITISKRLAQCMHPALPSGVHLKALETYDIIFKCIGSVRLSQELFIYSAGLFPLLGNAAMNVRPSLLTIYETHFIPLGEKLRPGLNGFLIGVLPGLEEGSDYYERTDVLLQKVCDEVERSYFYGCMWKCILSNPTIRLPAITFIISHFNKKLSMEDQLYIIGTDIDSMVQGLCASLQDNSVLVQRCALDLLLLGFPIHNNQLVASDMVRIVTAAVAVVLRRDMSLNRRLFSWLIGGEAMNATEEASHKTDHALQQDASSVNTYFKTYSKDLLLQALQVCFDSPLSVMSSGTAPSGSPELWCYRLLISLLDRPEISSVVLDDILIEVFRSLYFECQAQQLTSESMPERKSSKCFSKDRGELVKTANLLFATLEPWYLWAYSAKLFEAACQSLPSQEKEVSSKFDASHECVQKVGSGPPTIGELCTLLEFLLDVISLETYLEARTEHLPDLLCHIADTLSENTKNMLTSDIALTLNLCSKILSKVQPPVININVEDVEKDTSGSISTKSGNSSVPVQNPANSNSLKARIEDTNKEKETKHEDLVIGCSKNSDSLSSRGTSEQSSPNTASLPSNLTTAITSCIKKYQTLFVNFLKSKMLSNTDETLRRFQMLLLPKQSDKIQRDRKLEHLLLKCLESKCNCISSEEVRVFKRNINESILQQAKIDVQMEEEIVPDNFMLSEAFQRLCHLIVELSSFPTFCTNSKKVFEDHFSKSGTTVIPEWLKLLLSIACFVNTEDIFFSAVSTLFDLIALTKSVALNSETNDMTSVNSSAASNSKSQTIVSVVIIPVMTSSQLAFISEETLLFSLVATKLWKFVGDKQPNLCLRGTELLQQVHNLSPASSVCEDVICSSMTSVDEMEQIHSQKKFCILWHLTRDLSIKSTPLAMTKAFDRCLFIMLDNLGKETGSQKAIAQAWLNHSLQRGDVARFLEPILLILLHPDSARISVQHVSVHCPKKVTISDEGKSHEEFEAKIYAISSVSGNIIYHVSDDSHPSSQQGTPEKKILALTSIVNMDGNKGSKVVTHNSMLQDFELPSSHERDLQLPISLFVNPFGSLSSFGSETHLEGFSTPDFSQVKRIEVFRKSSFDDDGVDIPDILLKSMEATSENIVESILEELINQVVSSSEAREEKGFISSGDYSIEEDYSNFPSTHNSRGDSFNSRKDTSELKDGSLPELTVHPLHTYVLLYCQVYDSQKTLYALYSLKAIILTNPRITLCSMATTNVSSSLSSRGQQLQVLLARHRKSVFGNNFHGELNAETTTIYRSSTFVEVIVLTCLYHIRSYYPNLPQVRLTDEEVLGNRNVRLLCMEVLTLIFSELVGIVKDSGKSFASYLSDLLQRCKVQKTLLHCLVASVYDSQKMEYNELGKNVTFTETIVEFNDRPLNVDRRLKDKSNDFQDTFQVHLLRLMATLIVLEDTVIAQTLLEKDSRNTMGSKLVDFSTDRSTQAHHQSHITSSKYQQGVSIPAQSMFSSAVLTALRHKYLAHLHIHWLSLVTSALPFAGRWLSRLVMTVIGQLCYNLETAAKTFSELEKVEDAEDIPNSVQSFHMPPDYLITVIEGLTTLCHYCLLEFPAPVLTALNQTPLPPVPSQPYAPGTSASQIISNLIHVFSASAGQKDSFSMREPGIAQDPVLSARRSLLSNMPRIIASLSSVYRIITEVDKGNYQKACWIMGSPKIVKQHILSFLSPISLNYGTNFMAAVAVVWYEGRTKGSLQTRKVIPPWSPEQILLVQLVAAIKVLPIESIVQTVRNVLKQPPSMSQKSKVPLEVSTLQFFLAYIQHSSGTQLIESWQSLLGLWRDGLQLVSPPVQFHLLAILHEFVQRAPLLEDKKAQKDLQDIAHKLIEACSTVACASLEQTTWLWRNLAVRPGPQTDVLTPDVENEGYTSDTLQQKSENTTTQSSTDMPATIISNNAQYSVQALCILAEFLAPVLDFVYIGEEKEKVVPLLSNIMYYVTPYLKNHSSHNAPSFRACCQLLSSVSGYQHTRKAWRKDAFDLLLDSAFFQITVSCMTFWKAIVDHLMTHDKTTFRDFMARVSVAQSGSLNLFSSKEQEYEQRAHLLKRLAFVLFCSEVDQYQKYMPDIQERLTESLRLPHVPLVQAEVFLCFRVLLVRMSPHHVTSLWPVIITEMVQIFTQIEHELCTDSEEFSSHLRRMSTLDSSWVINSCNGLNAHNHPAWLHLYLSVCKLLDMAVALPANILPQFQMYRWAFVGDSPPLSSENNNMKQKPKSDCPEFVPHIMRLATLLNKKESCDNRLSFVPGQLLLIMPSIQTLQQLQPFFNTLSDITYSQGFHCNINQGLKYIKSENKTSPLLKSRSAPELYTLFQVSSASCSNLPKSTMEQIESVLQTDFVEIQACS